MPEKTATIELGAEVRALIARYMDWGEKQCTSTQATVAYCHSVGEIFQGIMRGPKKDPA